MKTALNTAPVGALALNEVGVTENGNMYYGTIQDAEKKVHEEYKHQVNYFRSIPFGNTYWDIITGDPWPMETLLAVLLALQDRPMARMRVSVLFPKAALRQQLS